jgi:sulfide:quinone oxidoreductase
MHTGRAIVNETSRTARECEVLVIGAGAAGTAVAARLLRQRPRTDLVIVDPGAEHHYQPGWTLVGGGAMPISHCVRDRRRTLPSKAHWLQEAVQRVDPDSNCVELASGERVQYRWLVVAPGLELNWQGIEGLQEALGSDGVTSNYRRDLAPYTDQLARTLDQGDCLFTQPAMPIKCAGAPQKALYLTADRLRRRGVSATCHFYLQGPSMFGVPLFARALEGVMEGYGAQRHHGHNLTAVDGPGRKAVFRTEDGDMVERRFDMLHVCPPQRAPEFIRASALAGEAGWVTVDKNSLRHTQYANVFALGDCTDTPNAKTAAAVRQQFTVAVDQLIASMDGSTATRSFDGYGSCPLTVAHGKVMLAEFRYDGEVVTSFPLDPTKPRAVYWTLKRRLLPWLYWNVLLEGKDWSWPHYHPRPDLVPTEA